MKQKIVLRVEVRNSKGKSALTVAADQPGVISVKMGGDGKDKLEVIGDEVDIVALALTLQKKVGHIRIISVMVLYPDNNSNEESVYNGGNQLALTTTSYYPGRSNEYYHPNSYGQYHQPYPY